MTDSSTVLIIDDEDDFRQGIAELLLHHGYTVLVASDGTEGLEMIARFRPDLIVLDMLMPRLSGFAVLERVKLHLRLQTPVVMLTGNSADQQESYAKILGVDAFLLKPISSVTLCKTIENLVANRVKTTEVNPNVPSAKL